MNYLGPLRSLKNARYLEIGTYEGRSLLWVMQNIFSDQTSCADVIDPFYQPGTREQFFENLRQVNLLGRVNVFEKKSLDILPQLPPNSYDLIYIDGDHSYRSVLFDALFCWSLLKVGGCLIFDDYYWGKWTLPSGERPEEAIDHFLELTKTGIQIHHKGWQVIVQKNRQIEIDTNFWKEPGQKWFSDLKLSPTTSRLVLNGKFRYSQLASHLNKFFGKKNNG